MSFHDRRNLLEMGPPSPPETQWPRRLGEDAFRPMDPLDAEVGPRRI